MKKRFFNIYLVIIIVIFTAIYLSLSYVKSTIRNHADEIIFLDDFLINGKQEDFSEHKIKIKDIGVFKCETMIDGEAFDRIEGDALLVIPRIRGIWHKIYFNDFLIGVIGAEGRDRIHLWNTVNKFAIPEELIENENILTFETYSEYKIGYGNLPIFISSNQLGTKIYYLLKMLYSNFYLVVIGMLFSMSILELVLFTLTSTYDRKYLLFPISILISAIYLLDYIVLVHPLLSNLLFKKLIISSLYGSAIVMSFALSKIYDSKVLKLLANVLFILLLIVIVFSNNLIVLGYFYNRLNLLLMLTVVFWIIISFKKYIRSKKPQDYMVAFAAMLLLGPGIHDTASLLLFDGRLMRLGIYGIVFYSIAILLIAMVNYVDHQKNIYSETKILEIEKEHLKKALIVDELTGLYNHRYFYEIFNNKIKNNDEIIDIILIDIDKFRPINDLKGHNVGDEILIKIAKIVLDTIDVHDAVFRYGGEEFIIMCYEYISTDPEEMAERIRRKIIEDEQLQELSGYLPLTVSIGIARYPVDSMDPKLIVSKAEKAIMYAKLNGRNRVCVYNASIDSQIEGNYETKIKNQMLLDFVYTLAGAIDLKDTYTGLHSEEVSRYAMLIAEEMSLDADQKYALRVGGLLHDLGKLSVPDTIIAKKGKLTEEEYMQVKSHPRAGYDIVRQIIDNNDAISCVRSHHERYDGKGYPDGLMGEKIPLPGRIICVADAYHAMISTRSYRKALTQDEAIYELYKYRGTQFDSEIVDVFIKILLKEKK